MWNNIKNNLSRLHELYRRDRNNIVIKRVYG